MKFMRLARELRPPAIGDLHVAEPQAVATSYREALAHLVGVVKGDGARMLVTLQPMTIIPRAKELTGFEVQALARQRARVTGSGEYFASCYEAMRRQLEELVREHPEVRVFDATRVFADEREVIFLDDCHLTRRGQQVLARAVGKRILGAW